MADYKKPDHWQLKARKEGYPARSVYKLKEMDEKFGLLKPAHSTRPFRVLDLGAAPGSWSLYVLRKAFSTPRPQTTFPPIPPEKSTRTSERVDGQMQNGVGQVGASVTEKYVGPPNLVSVDLSPLSRQYDGGLFGGGNFHFIQGDITDPVVRESVLSLGPYNLILSDAAPSTTGSRFIDSSRSLELAEGVVSYTSALAENGHLVVKVYQGGDSAGLLTRMKALFKTAKSYKPQACRGESFETYYLGKNLKRSVQENR
jgi:23S rRNA (uridine2552-2'-O)-methyltransferase